MREIRGTDRPALPRLLERRAGERVPGLAVRPATQGIPACQHSDARILDQIIYKWNHARHTIAASLADSYTALARDGWQATTAQIQRDVKRLFQDNFRNFAGLSA